MTALELENVTKTFPGTVALNGVSFSVNAGSIHALVGMNGSGKSTLVKILTGFHNADPGSRILVDGTELGHLHSEARSGGIRVVHQDLGLIGDLSVSENLAVGKGFKAGSFGKISWAKEHARAEELLSRLGYSIDPRTPVAALAMSERTGVAIARALGDWTDDVRVLILDEPTASMPGDDAQRLFSAVRQVAALGVAVVYISHRLDEIFDLSDTVTVLRDGEMVGTYRSADIDHSRLIELIVGKRLSETPRLKEASTAALRPLLEVDALSGKVVDGLDLVINAGEVVGVAGITGSGREELAGLVYGTDHREGAVRVAGKPLAPMRPDRAIALGLAYIPADRRAHAAFADMAVRENMTISGLTRHLRGGQLRRRSETNEVQEWISRLSVRCSSGEAPMESLSGGNQQKVVLVRWLRKNPLVFVLDEPSQGVDVSVKADLHQAIVAAANGGSAVLICSSDSEELERICDRVVVLVDGRIASTVSGNDLVADELDRLSLGHTRVSENEPTIARSAQK